MNFRAKDRRQTRKTLDEESGELDNDFDKKESEFKELNKKDQKVLDKIQ